MLTVGDVVDRTGAANRSIHFYDDAGLLPGSRDAQGYRIYHPSVVDTIRKIRLLLGAGYTLDLISALLPCTADHGAVDLVPSVAAAMRRTLETSPSQRRLLTARARRIEEHLGA